MPFLFDSVLGEIADSAGEARARRASGDQCSARPVGRRQEILTTRAEGADRLTRHPCPRRRRCRRSGAGRCLEARPHVLAQVRAAVADWKPMLARLDRAIVRIRATPVPLDRQAVDEAIAFLEWLRDDNFTFLGMREFHYSGGEEDGDAGAASKPPGLGILADPDVLRAEARHRGRVHDAGGARLPAGPDPLIVTKANAMSVVHRRAYLDYIGVKTYDDEWECWRANCGSSGCSPPPPTRAR